MSEAMSSPSTVPEPTPAKAPSTPPVALIAAVVWAILAVIFAIILLQNAKDEYYGGDAYTGIQNSVMWAVRGIAFLLFGSGALGIVFATRGRG